MQSEAEARADSKLQDYIQELVERKDEAAYFGISKFKNSSDAHRKVSHPFIVAEYLCTATMLKLFVHIGDILWSPHKLLMLWNVGAGNREGAGDCVERCQGVLGCRSLPEQE